MNQVNSPKLSYRAEIDGLRAIAVVSVIFYHAQMVLFGRNWFEGGFIGVDIFFVISGYLITRIILSELESKGSFSFLNFYERRARRILPMLFVVIFVSVPYAWQKLLPLDFVEYAESILASLFFGSNFFFYFSTTEYGADNAFLKPFLHTWSLGVEEQFYLVFPILAIVAFKYSRKHFLTILVGLSLLSLQFSELMEVRNSDLNFLLPFSRFWELAIGSMLAYRELYYKPSAEGIATKSLPVIGLYLITYSILFFDSKTPHPSFHTLMPIIGVALIIGFASKDELVGMVLGSKPFVWLGLISYSAYLWHFPIFAFSRMGKDPTNYEKFEWIALTMILSVLSYFLVEKPLRRDNIISKKLFFHLVLSSFISLSILNASVKFTNGYPQRINKFFNSIELDNKKLQNDSWSLLRKRLNESEGFDDATRKILIVGNSHAKDMFNALYQNKSDFLKTDFLRYGNNPNFQLSCFDESVEQYSKISNSFYVSEMFVDATTIVVSTSWRGTEAHCNKHRKDWPKGSDFVGLEYLIKRSKTLGKHIILMDQSPSFSAKKSGKETLVDMLLKNVDPLSADFNISNLKKSLSMEMYKSIDWKKHNNIRNQLLKISVMNDVPIFSKISVVCDLKMMQCSALTENNEKVFYDHHHYTLGGAKLIGERLVEKGFGELLK